MSLADESTHQLMTPSLTREQNPQDRGFLGFCVSSGEIHLRQDLSTNLKWASHPFPTGTMASDQPLHTRL